MGDLPLFSRDVREFIALLKKHDVKFVIVGGTAVIFHGYARYTGDVDFFYDSSPQNAASLLRAVQEFWQGDVPGELTLEELMVDGQIVQYGVPPHRIDLINRIDGVSFAEVWSDRQEESLTIDGVSHTLAIMGKKSLRQNKAAAGRDKDRDDLNKLQ